MLYDLNLAWTPSTTPQQLEKLLAFSSSLGYSVVALNHRLESPPPSTAPSLTIPRDITFPPTPQGATAAPATATPPARPKPTSSSPSSSPKLTILRRATLELTEAHLSFRLPTLAPHYDILAVCPLTAPAFQTACLTLDNVALISLDLTTHLPFPLRPRPMMAAIARGVRFEINYASLISTSTSDTRARANFIRNATSLVRATRGRGIIMSSGAGSALELRGPADVVNLMAVWGLGADKGKESIGSVPRGVVVNEGMRRRGFRGVVEVVKVVDGGDESERKKRKVEDQPMSRKQAKQARRAKAQEAKKDAQAAG